MEKIDFIPCLTWVQRGQEKKPEKIKHTKEELQEIIKELKLKEAEYESRPKTEKKEFTSKPPAGSDLESNDDNIENDIIDELYNMDEYDDEPVETMPNSNIEQLILDNPKESDSEDSDAEEDEFTVKPTDNLILVGHVEEDVCMLEVYVFNHDNAELFILHDIFLPSYPVSIEWLNFDPRGGHEGHFAAVGGMNPEIDIWDLNVIGSLEPAGRLGEKKKKSQRHRDAVMALSWNPMNRSVLASGSADRTVILWDLETKENLHRLTQFEEKVQTIKFHKWETQNLLTGACDGKVRLFDCRSPSLLKTWAFDGEIERVLWNHFDPFSFFASTEKGMLHCVDTRNCKSLWDIQVAEESVTGLCLSSHCRDLLVTGSTDEIVKVWDIKDNSPQLVTEKYMEIGKIYSLESCPDVPYVFCAGGNKPDNRMYLWDARECEAVVEKFRDRKFEDVRDIDMENNVEMDGEPQPSTSSQSRSSMGNGGRITEKKKATEVPLLKAIGKKKKNKKKDK